MSTHWKLGLEKALLIKNSGFQTLLGGYLMKSVAFSPDGPLLKSPEGLSDRTAMGKAALFGRHQNNKNNNIYYALASQMVFS